MTRRVEYVVERKTGGEWAPCPVCNDHKSSLSRRPSIANVNSNDDHRVVRIETTVKRKVVARMGGRKR